MNALYWHGKHDIEIDTVPEPRIINKQDAITRINAVASCYSDLHHL